jgi:hypothetical protein
MGDFDPLMRSHRSTAEYLAQAIKVPVMKREFEISPEKLQELITRGKHLDTRICEKGEFRSAKREHFVVLDAPWLEIIADAGKIRTRVTDTEGMNDVISENPELLKWALNVRHTTTAKAKDP